VCFFVILDGLYVGRLLSGNYVGFPTASMATGGP
jgi:hypothetical protein